MRTAPMPTATRVSPTVPVLLLAATVLVALTGCAGSSGSTSSDRATAVAGSVGTEPATNEGMTARTAAPSLTSAPGTTADPAGAVAPTSVSGGATPDGATGSYAAALPAADAEARLLTLSLADDGTASLITGYLGQGTVVESGSWVQVGTTVTVTLDVKDGTAVEDAAVLTFEVAEGNLVNTGWDDDEYGATGMGTLLRQP